MKISSKKSFLSFEFELYEKTLGNINQRRENGYKRIQSLITIFLAECGAVFWLINKTIDKFETGGFPWYIVSILTLEALIILIAIKLAYDGLCKYNDCEIDSHLICNYLDKQHEKIDETNDDTLISEVKDVLIHNYKQEIIEADNELSKHNKILYNMYKLCFGNLLILLIFFILLNL